HRHHGWQRPLTPSCRGRPLTSVATPGRMQATTESSTGDDRDEYLAETMQRTAVAAKRDPERQRKAPRAASRNRRWVDLPSRRVLTGREVGGDGCSDPEQATPVTASMHRASARVSCRRRRAAEVARREAATNRGGTTSRTPLVPCR